jgi:hypothetical protein
VGLAALGFAAKTDFYPGRLNWPRLLHAKAVSTDDDAFLTSALNNDLVAVKKYAVSPSLLTPTDRNLAHNVNVNARYRFGSTALHVGTPLYPQLT